MNNLYVKGLAALTAGGTGGSDPISKFFNIILELITPISMLPLPKRFKEKAGGFLVFLFIGGLIVAGAAQYAAYIESKMSF